MSAKLTQEPIVVVSAEADLKEVSAKLQSLGYKVRFFDNPKEAQGGVDSARPFLIIADFSLPETNGLNFYASLRAANSQGVFALVIKRSESEVKQNALATGVQHVFEKPLDWGVIQKTVESIAEARAAALKQEKDEEDEITVLFVEESKDLMSDVDQLLLRLEEDPIDTTVVDLLFRKIHSVKGGSAAVPAGKVLSKLAHHFETELARVKNGSWKPDARAIDVFLSSADLCRTHLDLIGNKQPADQEIIDRTDQLVVALEGLKSGSTSNTTSAADAPKFNPEEAAKSKSAQNLQQKAADPNQEDEGVFVTSEKLDSFMKVSGELVVLKNNLAMVLRDPESRTNPQKFDRKMTDFLQAMNKMTDNLQEQIMSVRKVTLERALSKLPRLVRQTAQDIDKKVQYKTMGFDIGVDKTIAKALSASLTHMVRNSVDHGIEKPALRMERGKDPQGTLTVTARELQGQFQIIIEDDGGGIDKTRVLKKALEKGLVDEARAATLTDPEIFELIFLPGFSTAEQLSSVSGRGVGMDVVRSSILALNGRISIESELGKGSKFVLDIPVPKTVMVEQTVIAVSSGTMIAVPLQAISRILPSEEVRITKIDQSWAFQHENRAIKLIHYSSLGGKGHASKSAPPQGSIIILRDKSNFVGIVVDEIYDQLEAVVRPFDSVINQIPGFRGTTVLGDDHIAYVISPAEVISISLGIMEQAA